MEKIEITIFKENFKFFKKLIRNIFESVVKYLKFGFNF
jgi:hypothetical protein